MKYHIWTEGCQMNVADSQRLASALEHLGYEPGERAEDADLIILNTCVVRQSAEDKAYGRLSSLKPLKKHNPHLIIGLMGCLVGMKDNPKLRERFPFVDVFAPPSNPIPLVNFIAERDGKQLGEAEQAIRYAQMDEELVIPASRWGKQYP